MFRIFYICSLFSAVRYNLCKLRREQLTWDWWVLMHYQRVPIVLLAFAVSILSVAHFFMLPRLTCVDSSEALESNRLDFAQILNEAQAGLHQFC